MIDFKSNLPKVIVLKKVSILVVTNHDLKLQDCVVHQTDIFKIRSGKEAPLGD